MGRLIKTRLGSGRGQHQKQAELLMTGQFWLSHCCSRFIRPGNILPNLFYCLVLKPQFPVLGWLEWHPAWFALLHISFVTSNSELLLISCQLKAVLCFSSDTNKVSRKSLDILSFSDHSLETLEMAMWETPSSSAVCEILWPARQTTTPHSPVA